ncbi:MAG: ribulose-phosphate 3-epimerase [Ignavibacteriales bacterium]|nr:ribulose-phosphate 3-epimerase [Ignavibacteriales bacterium]
MTYLAPSILAADFSNLAQQIRAVELGSADFIHCDIMDGKFVPNITFGPLIVSTVNKLTKLPLDVHLMINEPQDFIKQFAEAGADIITVHQENVVHLDRVINNIKELGVKAGIALNPATPIESILPVLHMVDLILIMSVNAGFGGQSFIDYTLEKIIKLDEIKREYNYNFLIEVDGGVNKENIEIIKNAGCNVIVAGTAVFRNENITAATVELKNILKK